MTDRIDTPDGYMTDAKGRLVPESMVPDAAKLRDELVRRLVARIGDICADMSRLKAELLDDIAEHLKLIASEYDVSIGGERGNVVLTSYDGLLKVERAIADRIVIGEQIQAAEALIRDILDEIDDPTARAIVDRAFRRDRKTGELSASRLIDLVSVEIDDERWRQAVRAIRDAMQVTGTATYFRAYERDASTAPWRQIQLDFSRIAPARSGASKPDQARSDG